MKIILGILLAGILSNNIAFMKLLGTGAVIEKVLMAPGDSGYFTGIVNATASSPVTFSLTTEDATAPAAPNYDNGDFSWTAEAAEQIGLAVGQKIAYTGGDTGGNGSTGGDTGNGSNNGGTSDTPGGNNGGTSNTPGGNGGNANDPGNTGTPGQENPDDSGKQGMSGGMIALIVILSLAVLAGAGVAVYIFIIKPKQAQKPAEKENSQA